MVLRQRVQILTVRITPLISMRRRWTFNTKRRRVRFCEKGTLLPCMGLRSHISQRPDIWIILSFFYCGPGLALKGLRPLGGNALTPPAPGDHKGLVKIPRIFLALPHIIRPRPYGYRPLIIKRVFGILQMFLYFQSFSISDEKPSWWQFYEAPDFNLRRVYKAPEHAMRVYHDMACFGKSDEEKKPCTCQKRLLSNHNMDRVPLAR